MGSSTYMTVMYELGEQSNMNRYGYGEKKKKQLLEFKWTI